MAGSWNNILNSQNRLGEYTTSEKRKKNKKKVDATVGTNWWKQQFGGGQPPPNPLYAQAASQGFPSGYSVEAAASPLNAASANVANAYNQLYADKGPGSTTIPVTPDDRNNNQGAADGSFKPWTGFAGGYSGAGADILKSDPRILVRDMLKSMGYNPNDGMIDILSKDADAIQYLMMMTVGAGPDSLKSQTDEGFINYGADWAKQMMTPGAGAPDMMAMIQNVLDAPDGSALSALLNDGTPQEQAAMLNQLLGVASGGMTPLAQKALMASLENKTDDWLSSKAKGGRDPLANWIQRGGTGVF